MTTQDDREAALVAEAEDLRRQVEEADAWIREATKMITGLTAGGSEFFARKVRNVYRADLPFCERYIRERFEREHQYVLRAVRERKAAERERDEVRGRLETVITG